MLILLNFNISIKFKHELGKILRLIFIVKKSFNQFFFSADAWVVRSSELATGGQQIHTKTHLGHLLNIGDLALGFDLVNANVNDSNLDALKAENIPDVVCFFFKWL
jgi:hypothetical protein